MGVFGEHAPVSHPVAQLLAAHQGRIDVDARPQTALLFAEKGNAPAKMIESFRKKGTKPALKSAWIDEAVFIGDDQVAVLSKLKGKEELIGEIIALLQSPIKNVIGSLQGGGGQKIAGLVKALEARAQA